MVQPFLFRRSQCGQAKVSMNLRHGWIDSAGAAIVDLEMEYDFPGRKTALLTGQAGLRVSHGAFPKFELDFSCFSSAFALPNSDRGKGFRRYSAYPNAPGTLFPLFVGFRSFSFCFLPDQTRTRDQHETGRRWRNCAQMGFAPGPPKLWPKWVSPARPVSTVININDDDHQPSGLPMGNPADSLFFYFFFRSPRMRESGKSREKRREREGGQIYSKSSSLKWTG